MRIFSSKNFTIEPGFCILVAVALLIFPPNWVFAWLAAAAFHELCHCLALWLCGATIYSFRICLTGAVIDTESMTSRQEFLSALAGPLGGLSLLILLRLVPQLAICALLQTLYNMLPIYPLDGGRALLCCVKSIFGGDRALTIYRYVKGATIAVLLLCAAVATFVLKAGFLPLGVVLLLWIKSGTLKTPCKQPKQIVQ